MKESNSMNYLIRLCDQTSNHIKCLYASITKEQLDKITDILEATEEDWD